MLSVFVLRLRRSVKRSLLVTETQVTILSARVTPGLTEELACELYPYPAASMFCNLIFIFFKQFYTFFFWQLSLLHNPICFETELFNLVIALNFLFRQSIVGCFLSIMTFKLNITI